MTCPWLIEKEDGYECSAVSPPAEIDFVKPSPPDVNGDICKLPEPDVTTNPPWDQCKRWKPVGSEGEEPELAKEVRTLDHRIIYASLILIIALGIITNLSEGMINSVLSIYIIVLIALGNIGYLYTRLK